MTNPFLELALKQIDKNAALTDYYERLAEARGMIQQSGVEVGDDVTVWWTPYQQFGFTQRNFAGKIVSLDDWIRVESAKGYFYSTITGLDAIVIQDNPFLNL